MSGPDAVALLRSELSHDVTLIKENYRKNREMTTRIEQAPGEDEFEYAALGYTLHNLYTAFEAYFIRVAKFFENQLDDTGWHKSLLDRMTLEVPGVRPALLRADTAEKLRELLQFRHVFRNLYKSRLIPEKLDWVNEAARGLPEEFEPQHEAFDAFLADLSSMTESSF